MLKKMMIAAAFAGAFMAVPAAAQDAGNDAHAEHQAAVASAVADGTNKAAGNVARQMLDMVAKEAKMRAAIDQSGAAKKRLISLNDAVRCADCEEEKHHKCDEAKCDDAAKCKKAKCQGKA